MARGFTIFALLLSLIAVGFDSFFQWGQGAPSSAPADGYRSMEGGGGPPPTPPPCLKEGGC
jgi:hypothetical protein